MRLGVMAPRHGGDIPPMREIHRQGNTVAFPLVITFPCRSRTGLLRPRHVADKDGVCIFCDRRVGRRKES